MNKLKRLLHWKVRQFSKWLSVLFCAFFLLAWNSWQTFAAQEHNQHDVTAVTEEMVVVADKLDDFVRQNPSQVESMGAAEIESRNFLQVQEVLGAMPGVDVTSGTGGLGSRISIRGGG